MCLPFHLYSCSKPSLFWFQVIKINWTFNLISKPCPFLCRSRVGNGQFIAKSELKVFSIFLLTQTLGSHTWEDWEPWPERPAVLFLYSGSAEWSRSMVLSPGCALESPGRVSKPWCPGPTQTDHSPNLWRWDPDVFLKVVQVILVDGPVGEQVLPKKRYLSGKDKTRV